MGSSSLKRLFVTFESGRRVPIFLVDEEIKNNVVVKDLDQSTAMEVDAEPVVVSFDVGIRNTAICILGTVSGRIHDWRILDMVGPRVKSIARVTNQRLCDEAAARFGEVARQIRDAGQLDVQAVLIEDQGRAVARVKMVGFVLFGVMRTYFPRVEFVHGRHKLESCLADEAFLAWLRAHRPRTKVNPRKKMTYAVRKARSVQWTEYKLTVQGALNADRLTFLAGQKKRDDLCDAYLQALWFTTPSPS